MKLVSGAAIRPNSKTRFTIAVTHPAPPAYYGVTAGIAAKNQGGNKLCVTVSATIGGGLSSLPCSAHSAKTVSAAAATTTAAAAAITTAAAAAADRE